TPMVVTPSPSQSPTTGFQPRMPYAKGAMSGAPEALLLRRYQTRSRELVDPVGSTTPTVSTPSPFQSPTTGSQPTAPYWKTMSAAPGVLLLRRYQVPVDGSKAPIVSMPSPFQSPTTGVQVRAPKAKGVTS